MLSDNPILAYELKKNHQDHAPHPNYHLRLRRTNSDGLRDRERSIPKPPATKRLIMLGDSVVMGISLPEANAIPQQMERILAQSQDEPLVEVLNFGISGYNTLAEAELLRLKGPKYSPDAVVLIFTENDFENFNGKIRDVKKVPRWHGLETLFLRSSAFRYFSLRLDLFRFRAELDGDYLRKQNAEAIGMNHVERGIEALSDLSTRHNFKLIVLAWPHFDGNSVIYPMFVRCDDDIEKLRIERVAEDYDVEVLRMDRAFEDDFKRRRDLGVFDNQTTIQSAYVFCDKMHPSPQGAQYSAEIILDLLSAEIDWLKH